MSVTMKIEVVGQEVATTAGVAWHQGITGIQVMQEIVNFYESNPAMKPVVAYKLKNYGPGNDMLIALDNIEMQLGADGHTFIFWELLLNGQASNFGIDELHPADGDRIEWNFTRYSSEQHDGTIYEALRDHVRAEMALA